jgi:hypothetical protein
MLVTEAKATAISAELSAMLDLRRLFPVPADQIRWIADRVRRSEVAGTEQCRSPV